MKYAYLFIICIWVLSTSSCTDDPTYRYTVDVDATFDIPGGLNTIETHYFIVKNVPTFYKQYADLNKVDTSSITNVLASRGLLTGTFQDVDYDFVSRVSIYAVSQKNPDLKREMYYLDQVPLTTNGELRMLSSSTELKEILKDEYIDLEIRLNFRNFTGSNLRTRLEFGYAVF